VDHSVGSVLPVDTQLQADQRTVDTQLQADQRI
jgi:hypothetical protein